MELLYADVAAVSLAFGVRMQFDTRLFEQAEVMLLAIAEAGADNLWLATSRWLG